MKARSLYFVVLAVLFIGCGGTQADQETQAKNTPQASGTATRAEETTSEPRDLPIVAIDASGGKEVGVRVEIADDPLERARGLMYRTALGEDRGMLFIYPEEEVLSFWMRNTSLPLSIAFIDSKGRITDIMDMRPFDDTPPHYVSSKPVVYALEVNRGFFEERGVEVGDHAEIPG